jgi:spore germination cell wall hydrolase CwlJ-like protein
MKKLLISALLAVSGVLGSATLPPLVPVKHNVADIRCLAENIYHEARGEPFIGQLAVAQVTVNRFQSNRHGNSICAVVHQRKQFSWTTKKPRVRDSVRWQTSYTMAQFVLLGAVMPNFLAHFYHTRAVNPKWNQDKHVIRIIGNHVFYS